MPVQSEESVRETFMVQESVRETVTVQEGSSMNSSLWEQWDPLLILIGCLLSWYWAKRAKTQGQSIAIWVIIMGAVLFYLWQFN